MLWVARGFALLVAVIVLSALITDGLDLFDDRLVEFGYFVTSLLWVVFAWFLKSSPSRLFLGTTSVLASALLGVDNFAAMRHWTTAPLSLWLFLLGFAVMIWVAIRPPQSCAHSTIPSKNPPLPQSC